MSVRVGATVRVSMTVCARERKTRGTSRETEREERRRERRDGERGRMREREKKKREGVHTKRDSHIEEEQAIAALDRSSEVGSGGSVYVCMRVCKRVCVCVRVCDRQGNKHERPPRTQMKSEVAHRKAKEKGIQAM